MLALSSAIEPLRSANRLLGVDRYQWNVLGARKGPIRASNGLETRADYDLSDPPDADLTIIVASLSLDDYTDKKLMGHIRWLHRQGNPVGAISNGTWLLAAAGILAHRHVTIHWESLETLAASYPDVDVSAELFCIDKTIFTAAGGASAMDLMLELIGRREGRDIAADVAEQFLHGKARASSEFQRNDLRWRYKLTDKRLETVIRLMEENHVSPISISKLAERVELSERQLERLFSEQVKATPSRFYLDLRLNRAWTRLVASTDTLEEIAEISGFSSQAHFSRAFKLWSGASPLTVRRDRRREESE